MSEDFIKDADKFFEEKKYQESLELYKKAYGISLGNNVHVYARLSILYRMLEDYDNAEKYLIEGLEKFSSHPRLLIEYAALENKRQHWQSAIKLWKKAKENSKKFSLLNYKRYLDALWKNKDYNEYNKILLEAASEFPNSSDILNLKTSHTESKNEYEILEFLKKNWQYKAVNKQYEKLLKMSCNIIPEYMKYLTDTGQLDIIYHLIDQYGIDFLEQIPTENKDNHEYILKLFTNEFIPSVHNSIENDPIKKLIYLTNKSSVLELFIYLKNNIRLLSTNDGKIQMYLNYALNKLIDNNLLHLKMAIEVIKLYTESNKINKQRKKFVLSKIIDYFEQANEIDFFEYLKIGGGHLHKIASAIHRYGDNEPGAKKYSHKLYTLIKNSSNIHIKPKKTAKVAVCISGMFRGDAKKVLESINKNVIEPLDADVFVHTWDEKHDWMGIGGDINWVYRLFGQKLLNECPEELKTLPYLIENFPQVYNKLKEPVASSINEKKLLELINPVALSIENQDFFIESLGEFKEDFRSRGHFNQAKMFYGIFKVTELMKEYECKNNIQYDYVIRCRPDIGLNNKLSMDELALLDRNEILVDFFPYGPQDQFRAGRREEMIVLSDIWKEMINIGKLSPFVQYPTIDAHNLLYLWMIKNDIITVPTIVKRDVSMAIRSSKMPDISLEFENDYRLLLLDKEKRDHIKSFFKKLMERT